MLPDAALDALFTEARAQAHGPAGDGAASRADRGAGPGAGVDVPEGPGDLPGLPPALAARILADADRLGAERDARALAARAAARSGAGLRVVAPGLVPAAAGGGAFPGGGLGLAGFWVQLSRALGGGPALAGLLAVTAAGLWLGLAPPEMLQSGLDSLTGNAYGADPYLVDSTTAFEFLQTEE